MTTTTISIGQRSPPWRTGLQRSWRRSAWVRIWNAGASRPLVSSNWIGGSPRALARSRSSPRPHVMPRDESRRKVTARYGPDTRYSARSIAHGIPVIRDFIPRWQEIGRRFGPFDVTLIEAGQYDADWPDWHLGPEQAVEAHRLVRGKRMIPVHWGLLKLAHHSWTEPVERVLAAAKCRNVDVLVPRPGESIEPARSSSRVRWWPEIPWLSAHETPIVATRDGVASQRFEALPTCHSVKVRQSDTPRALRRHS